MQKKRNNYLECIEISATLSRLYVDVVNLCMLVLAQEEQEDEEKFIFQKKKLYACFNELVQILSNEDSNSLKMTEST